MTQQSSRSIECEAACIDCLTEEWTDGGEIVTRLSGKGFNRSMVRSLLLHLASRRLISMRQITRMQFKRNPP